MSQKTFNTTAGLIFLIVALLHAVRVLQKWDAIVGGWRVPMILSIVAAVIAGYLA
jgi:hypothetical protein